MLTEDLVTIRVPRDHGTIIVYGSAHKSPQEILTSIIHHWQPLLRVALGMQVLHASAVLHARSRSLLILSGSTHSGKSTLAFGIQQRSDWQHIADDFIGFRAETNELSVVPLPNLLRLRPRSADFFRRSAHESLLSSQFEPGRLSAVHLVFLRPHDLMNTTPSLRPIRFDEAVTRVLEHAFAVNTKDKSHNRSMMHAYFRFAQRVPMSEVTYRRDFREFSHLVEQLEKSVLAQN